MTINNPSTCLFQDLADKFTSTGLLLNGQAVCYIGQQRYEEAAQALREALDRDPNDYDTLVNSAVLADLWTSAAATAAAAGTGADLAGGAADQQVQRLLGQIRDSHAGSQLVAELDRKEAEFDRLCCKYEPSVTAPPVEEALALSAGLEGRRRDQIFQTGTTCNTHKIIYATLNWHTVRQVCGVPAEVRIWAAKRGGKGRPEETSSAPNREFV